MRHATGRFRRSDRLRSSRDYRRVSSRGRRISSREFVVLIAESGPLPTGRARLGITASRRVGNAVARNRVKRAIRSWFRTSSGSIDRRDAGVDIVVIAKREATDLTAEAIAEKLSKLLAARDRAR